MVINNDNEQMSKRDFLERIARMYYIIGLNQKDIAKQMNIGRSSVARFLNEAKEQGIIEFHINSKTDYSRNNDLEKKLISTFKLKDAVVIKKEQGYSFEAVAANYLNSILPFEGSIGLGLGKTMYAVGKVMQLCDDRPNLEIVQVTGSGAVKEKNIPTTSVIQTWADSLDAKPYFLPAPAVVDSKEDKEFFMNNANINYVYQKIRNVDVVIVSIGHTDPDTTILSANLLPWLTSEQLKKHSVGDIIFHYFNEMGDFSFPELSERVVGATPIDFLRTPLRIAIANDRKKQKAILGALKGRLLNILIVDDETANHVMTST